MTDDTCPRVDAECDHCLEVLVPALMKQRAEWAHDPSTVEWIDGKIQEKVREVLGRFVGCQGQASHTKCMPKANHVWLTVYDRRDDRPRRVLTHRLVEKHWKAIDAAEKEIQGEFRYYAWIEKEDRLGSKIPRHNRYGGYY